MVLSYRTICPKNIAQFLFFLSHAIIWPAQFQCLSGPSPADQKASGLCVRYSRRTERHKYEWTDGRIRSVSEKIHKKPQTIQAFIQSWYLYFSSIVELFGEGDSSISVLRSFRLLRIFKLVRFLPALRRQLLVMIHTMDNVVTFLALLALFIFTASVLGMNLFGGKYTFEDEDGGKVTARANFDDLFWALVTVFQVRVH